MLNKKILQLHRLISSESLLLLTLIIWLHSVDFSLHFCNVHGGEDEQHEIDCNLNSNGTQEKYQVTCRIILCCNKISYSINKSFEFPSNCHTKPARIISNVSLILSRQDTRFTVKWPCQHCEISSNYHFQVINIVSHHKSSRRIINTLSHMSNSKEIPTHRMKIW